MDDETLENPVALDDDESRRQLMWELMKIDGFDDWVNVSHTPRFVDYYQRLADIIWNFGQFRCPVIRRKCLCFKDDCRSCTISNKLLITLYCETVHKD